MNANSMFETGEEIAARLLDVNQKLHVDFVDSLVECKYSGHGGLQRLAYKALAAVKEHPDTWTRVEIKLKYSTNQQNKYFALQLLELVVKTRWKGLPRNQREGIKNVVQDVILKTSYNRDMMEREVVFLNKLNLILVQILKQEWPRNWESFIPNLVRVSTINESICQNNMTILKLLGEEVFDYSRSQMMQIKAKLLRDTLRSEFGQILQLCELVLENSRSARLVGSTLETLLAFLSWIPLGHIFETQLIATLTSKFLNIPMFRNVTLKCLTEIAAISVTGHDEMLTTLFTQTMIHLEQMLPLNTDIRKAYPGSRDLEQNFIENLATFLSTFFKEHGALLERQELNEIFMKGLNYLVLISEVNDVKIFKICLEYWNSLFADLYEEICPQRQLFHQVLFKVRSIVIDRMAKPEEVLVVENENGEVVRELMKDIDSIDLHNDMRETLVRLTRLDYEGTVAVMVEKLQNQTKKLELMWKDLNTICWSIGCISEAMDVEKEIRFFVVIFDNLLVCCEQKRGEADKVVVASNFMYLVGKYTTFFQAHFKLLKVVVNKLFEFMCEPHLGIQDMACDTFVKIASKCSTNFVTTEIGETEPFINVILVPCRSIVCDLQAHQVHSLYEAVGHIINAVNGQEVRNKYILLYMSDANKEWDNSVSQIPMNVRIFKDQKVIKKLADILKINVRACKTLGHNYIVQFQRIVTAMLFVYKVMSKSINAAIVVHGEEVVNKPLVKSLRVVKKETLRLIAEWVSGSSSYCEVMKEFLPPAMDAVLFDYQRTLLPSAREPEVLSGMCTILNKLQSSITSQVSKIFDAVFKCTCEMINKDFEEYPEHQTSFFLLLQAVNEHCFTAFLSIPPAQFKLVLDSIILAFKHPVRDVADMGLQILYQLLKNLDQHDSEAQRFYRTYFTDIVQSIFSVMTETSHSEDLTMHASILAHMFSLVELGRITVPLGRMPDNSVYVREYMAGLLRIDFPHLSNDQIKITVQGLFSLDQDVPALEEHLRDFLVQIMEFSGEDGTDLFLEEREQLLQLAQDEKRQVQIAVGGKVDPQEIQQELLPYPAFTIC